MNAKGVSKENALENSLVGLKGDVTNQEEAKLAFMKELQSAEDATAESKKELMGKLLKGEKEVSQSSIPLGKEAKSEEQVQKKRVIIGAGAGKEEVLNQIQSKKMITPGKAGNPDLKASLEEIVTGENKSAKNFKSLFNIDPKNDQKVVIGNTGNVFPKKKPIEGDQVKLKDLHSLKIKDFNPAEVVEKQKSIFDVQKKSVKAPQNNLIKEFMANKTNQQQMIMPEMAKGELQPARDLKIGMSKKQNINDILLGKNAEALENTNETNIAKVLNFQNKKQANNSYLNNNQSQSIFEKQKFENPVMKNFEAKTDIQRVLNSDPASVQSNIEVMSQGEDADIFEAVTMRQPAKLNMTKVDAPVLRMETMDLSHLSQDEVIGKVSDYITQKSFSSQKEIELQVAHKDLGQFQVKVAQEQMGKGLNIQITTTTVTGKEFFESNQARLMTALSGSGLQIGDLKLDSSNSQFAGNNSSEQGQQQGQNKNSQQNQDSQRRRELWQQYKERAS